LLRLRMTTESAFIASLQALATHPAARGLKDDVAVLSPPLGRDLVLTHDVLVEGIHYRAEDPPGDVAWKLLAVNLSDLAGKGARPIGVLTGIAIGPDSVWDMAFVAGLGRALGHFDTALLGGDTTASPGPRVLGLTAIGWVPPGGAPSRTGARPGDRLWVTGTIGDAGAGLHIADPGNEAERFLAKRYRLPMPRLAAGVALAPHVSAMMDVSDGLLLDARRMAAASGVSIEIDLAVVPLSDAWRAIRGDALPDRLEAASSGDDYELLFAAGADADAEIESLSERLGLGITPVGRVGEGAGLSLVDRGTPVALPERLGFEHGRG